MGLRKQWEGVRVSLKEAPPGLTVTVRAGSGQDKAGPHVTQQLPLILSLPMPNGLGQVTTLANGMFSCVSLKGLRVGLWTLSSQQDFLTQHLPGTPQWPPSPRMLPTRREMGILTLYQLWLF